MLYSSDKHMFYFVSTISLPDERCVMNFDQSCQVLNAWIDQSRGQPIRLPSGNVYAFSHTKHYTPAEIQAIEDHWHVPLPADYRHFLTAVGAIDCFISHGAGFTFLPLESIAPFTEKVFAGFDNPFPHLLLAVTLVRRGEYAGFDISRSPNQDFTVFIPDIPPEVWLTDASGWGSFSKWFTRLIESEGEIILPW